ncbi:NACHT and WD repeat domain-containing protein 2 [Kryptolebias marmoratus]|uniref:NACHT and WD repeat domain-containing protein 2 n=1 Tax=Kryptolebias marmoratus TaxID=37003 RepID=UPI000D530E27|nr:NACHT and WD repeat domain-containing protein 2 [Kryptolebias marmoratus]
MHPEGEDGSLSSCGSSCVKIYVCSNPDDSVTERRDLREKVFPRFGEHCRRSLGLDVRVIDPFESSDPSCWPDERTRQQLIDECRSSSAGPFFLALVGHQYGAAGLPTQVEVSEYQLLLQESQQAGVCTRQLEAAYQRDENILPPSYRLKLSPTAGTGGEADGDARYKEEEEEVREEFQTAVSLCIQNKVMTPEMARVFYRSALDADLRFALGECPLEDIVSRCVVYVHKVTDAEEDKGKKLTSSQLQPKSEDETLARTTVTTAPTQAELLAELCDDFLPALVASRRLLLYTTTTECDRRHGYTAARRRGYADSLCRQVLSDLLMMTDSVGVSLPGTDAHSRDALSEEQLEQERLCNILSRLYDISRPEEDEIRAYVELRGRQGPLVVTGGPCTGKTVLMACCTQQIKSWLPGVDPVMIGYFCSLSINTTPEHLLSSLCSQIVRSLSRREPDFGPCRDPGDPSSSTDSRGTAADHSHNEHPSEESFILSVMSCSAPKMRNANACLSELKERLDSLLSQFASTTQPLILLLDGLDQLEDDGGAQIIRSLPSPLPDGVRLIATVTPSCARLLQAVEERYSGSCENESGYVRVRLEAVDRKQCAKLLESLLKRSGRRVTSGQQALVNRALTSCCLPFYARLLHAHTSLWHSDSDVTESSLPDGVHASISSLLGHLELKHGSSLVARSASCLSLSRAGLSQAELADLLCSCGDVPQVSVERLLLDLKDFLVERSVSNTQVLFWVSRHFKLVVGKKYLGDDEWRRRIHSEMASYFHDRWVRSNGKPLLVEHLSGPNNDPDTQPHSQPFLSPSADNAGHVGVRSVGELPHHLRRSGRMEELECGLLKSSGFHQALVQAGLLGDLVAMLEAAEGSTFLRERLLLASILKSSACLLQSSPMRLPAVMETSLLPYLGVFPALEGFVQDIRWERRKSRRGLGLALCPGPCFVPPIQFLRRDAKTEEGCVSEVAGGECGVVAEVMADGSVWIWKGCGHDLAELSLSCGQQALKFAGVKSSGRFLLLSTRCNKLFAWDATDQQRLVEVIDPLKTEFGASRTPNRVEGFVVWQRMFCLWWGNETFVSVFDMSTETMTHFQCQDCVTCVVCSLSGFCMYCGQEDGTVSAFDMKTNSPLGSCSNRSAVALIILREEKHEMACVDRTGSIALWDIADEILPPGLVKEVFIQDKSRAIQNTDHAEDSSALLVCQSHQVTLWDTHNWELWDQFSAPRGRAFLQALLSMDAHLFLALLDSCTSIMVWRLSTGECVLSLETSSQPLALLRVASDVVCVHHDGCLTAWDSEMIDAAETSPKMRGGVKGVAVEQTRKWFYTTDGSENVWKWSLDTGLPHVSFVHEGPVDELRLSPNGICLVSISGGEIYVWQTETGQNSLRICGSRATNVLITPNGNFGVSISKQGLSRVWKLAHGAVVCSIHQHLSDAQVSPESTFLIGLRGGDLLAASLWSGSISKCFSCVDVSERVVAFHVLSKHPNFVVVMAASGAVYTWKVSEETVCQHFQLPNTFHCQPQDFQMSSDGSYALLSAENNFINVLDLSRVRLCSFKAEGLVLRACLDKTGCYLAYIFDSSSAENSCTCLLHASLTLTVARLSDGERLGSVRLCKNPSALIVSEPQGVFVGFEDGSVGVYSVFSDVRMDEQESVRRRGTAKGRLEKCPFDREPLNCFCQFKPNVTWR